MSERLAKIRKNGRLVRSRLREQGVRLTLLWMLEHAVRVTTGAPGVNTSRIGPGIVLGGQYRSRGWRRLQAAGVTSVLNLRSEFCDREAGIAPAQYLRLPTVDDEAPSPEQLGEGVSFIDQQVAQGGGVYVHCGAGMGRAATMVAAYLVAQGLGPDEAWARIRRVRPFIRPTQRQHAAIEAWAARCRPSPSAGSPSDPLIFSTAEMAKG